MPSTYEYGPDSRRQPGVPQGDVTRFQHVSAIFPAARHLISIEDLSVRGLARSKLAKSVHDAAWGQFRMWSACQSCCGRPGAMKQEARPKRAGVSQ